MPKFEFPPLLTVILVLAWGGAGFWAGDYNRNNVWIAKQAEVQRKAQLDYQAEVKRGNEAASQAILDAQVLQNEYADLEGRFNELRARVPLVVYKTKPVTESGAVLAAGNPVEAGASANAPVSLSLGALWMWNSALIGYDTTADSCGASDTSGPACAADSGVGIEAAWSNQEINAKSCAIDRLRHQKLINFLNNVAAN